MELSMESFNSINGLLKVAEFILAYTLMIMARLGGRSHYYYEPYEFGSEGAQFFVVGVLLAFCIILPGEILTYFFGAHLSLLEIFLSAIGAALYTIAGAITLYNSRSFHGKYYDIGVAIGSLCIIMAIAMIVDFLVALKNTKITVIQTRTL
ncbi:uncharacterized protein [Lepeophtheirus salmonis]|uniref:Putative LOC100740689 [Bombus impatiens] n=1 Tax=Lepeophtheirus salmonis TaxID=72036 RepID=A0A0K2UIN8_LEPSM|nr:uncharacterized protein LOC121126227 [Lepeophtheirus salmonis]